MARRAGHTHRDSTLSALSDEGSRIHLFEGNAPHALCGALGKEVAWVVVSLTHPSVCARCAQASGQERVRAGVHAEHARGMSGRAGWAVVPVPQPSHAA